MRRRRIERCVRRATDALGAGTLDVATEAIDEAAHLDPADEQIKSLAARIRAAAVPPAIVIDAAPPPETSTVSRGVDGPALILAHRAFPSAAGTSELESADGLIALEEKEPSGGSRHWFAIAAALIVLSGATGWVWTRAQFTSAPQEPDRVVSIAETPRPARDAESTAPALGTAPPEPTTTTPSAQRLDRQQSRRPQNPRRSRRRPRHRQCPTRP
jgi:hypothetical protein